jgi:hypothetical protein
VAKPYRGFESTSLRQQVLTTEKFRRPIPRNTRNMPSFRNSFSINRTAENGLLGGEGDFVPAFLWRANSQSGFKEGVRRMQCDQKAWIRP